MTTTPTDPPTTLVSDEGAAPPEAPPTAALPSEGRAASRRVRIALLVAALAVIGLIIWLVWPNSSTPTTHAQPEPINANSVTTVGGQALLSAVRAGEGTTYHASYNVVGNSQQIGGDLTLEVWQSPPQAREDTVLVHGGQTTHTESFSSGSGGHLCSQSNGGAWTCQVLSSAQAAVSGPNGILTAISGEISGHGVSMQKQTIDGRDVTCYTLQVSAMPRLCATSNGIPVLIADKDVRYSLQSLSDTVNATVFALPTHH